MTSLPFDRGFQGSIPLPLSRLYTRTFHARGERDRHDHSFHLVESALKLASSVLVSRYRSCGERSGKVDEALARLALPSLGQWRDIFREALGFLARRDGADPHSRSLFERLTAKGEDPRIAEVFQTFAKAIDHAGRRPERPSVHDLLDLLPSYRNAMSDAHGSIKASSQAYREGTSALLSVAGLLLEEGRANVLGGGRLVWSEEVKYAGSGGRCVVWMDLTGPAAIRRQGEGEATEEEVLPRRVYLEIGPGEHWPLHPLLHYRPDELLDQVFFLNRARGGKSGVQFLCYDTGDFYYPGRDEAAAGLVDDAEGLLAWASAAPGPGKDAPAAAGPPPEAPPSGTAQVEGPEAAVRRFGDFEILEELGRGGMAVVYRARQASLDRVVALKVLPPSLRRDPVSLARFRQEVRALARFDHPNVVKIFSSGEAEGTCYYAMEYIDGASLASVAKELQTYHARSGEVLKESHFEKAVTTIGSPIEGDPGRGLPPSPPARRDPLTRIREDRVINFRLAAVISGAAKGVQHIHEHGFIHRDLKPQNIMITRERLEPVIMDLGLAKLLGSEASITRDRSSVLGTLRYMAPEQLQRNFLTVDARADVYALGAVLYELVCYRPMLDGETEERLTTQVILEEPPPPQKVNPRVPGDLANIITRATQKNPRERYGTAGELAEDLDRFLHGEAPRAKAPTVRSQVRRYVHRHRMGLATIGLMIAIIAGSFTGGTWYLRVLRSRKLWTSGQGHWSAYQESKGRREKVRETWLGLLEARRWQPPWESQEEIEAYRGYQEVEGQAEQSFNQAAMAYTSALEVAPPGSAEVRKVKRALEDLYWEGFRESQEEGHLGYGPEFFRRRIESLGVGTYVGELEGRGRISLGSSPPGAEVFCFRYQDRDERLVPLPFDPVKGLKDPEAGLIGKPRLLVEKVRDTRLSPFADGDVLLSAGGQEVFLEGDFARALQRLAVDEPVGLKALRGGKETGLSWVPFPKSIYDGAGEPLRSGDRCKVVSVLDQFGFTFSAYPLDARSECRAGVTGEGSPVTVDLPRGSYLFLFRKAGYVDARYPVAIPSETKAETVPLLEESAVPDGYVYIPAGPVAFGGDREAFQSLDRGVARVEGFLMKRLEVTIGEYLEFVNDPQVFPRIQDDGKAPLVEDAKRSIQLIPFHYRRRDLLFKRIDPRDPKCPWECKETKEWPVLGIPMLAGREYARWLTAKRGGGRTYRLPTDLEWEWAARGADRRTFVWGNYPFWSFTSSLKEKYLKGGSHPAEVGTHPADESVFGVRDLGGSLSEPTTDRVKPRTIYGSFYTVRGGNWYTPDDYYFRVATRNGRLPDGGGMDEGIRLVAELK